MQGFCSCVTVAANGLLEKEDSRDSVMIAILLH